MTVSIRKIAVQNWALYETEQVIALPERGLVVISGQNGEGKSALVEAVSHALWGRSIRDKGKGCWRDVKDPSRVTVELADRTRVARELARGTSARLFIENGKGEISKFATATKAQTELDALAGDFSTWRSACVFHAASATARFGSATDAERKRLIDALMGVDVFDAASSAARADLRAAETRVAEIEREHVHLVQRLGLVSERFNDQVRALRAVHEPLEHVDDPDAPTVDVAELQRQRAQLEQQLLELTGEADALAVRERELTRKVATLRERLTSLDKRTKALEGAETCPTCQGPAGADVAARVGAARGKLAGALTAAETEAATLATDIGKKRAAAQEINRRVQPLAGQIAGAEAAGRAARRAREATEAARARAQVDRDRINGHVQKLGAERLDVEELIDGIEAKQADAASDVAELRAADKALGVTGIRATVTGELLGSIDQLANYWLGLIDERLGIELRASRELADGRTRDEIELRLTGAGGGLYADASTGQQRRIDLALMLALAEVAGGSMSHGRSTLFFDEVFGALDSGGCRAVARVLRELAGDHCVVVLTHVDQLAEDLGADVHVQVRGGKITQVKS